MCHIYTAVFSHTVIAQYPLLQQSSRKNQPTLSTFLSIQFAFLLKRQQNAARIGDNWLEDGVWLRFSRSGLIPSPKATSDFIELGPGPRELIRT